MSELSTRGVYYRDYVNDAQKIAYATGGLNLLLFFLTFILWIVLHVAARRKGDPARYVFTFAKLATPWFILFLLLTGVSSILANFSLNGIYTALYISDVGNFAENVATALLLVGLTHFTLGLLYARTGTYASRHQPAKIAAAFFAALIVLLSLVAMIIFCYVMGELEARSIPSFRAANLSQASADLRLVVVVFFFTWTLLLVAFAITTHVGLGRAKVGYLKVSVLNIVATVLMFVAQLTWLVVTAVARSGTLEDATTILLFIFASLPKFIVLVLLLFAARRTYDGLSSTHAKASPVDPSNGGAAAQSQLLPVQQPMGLPNPGFMPQQQQQPHLPPNIPQQFTDANGVQYVLASHPQAIQPQNQYTSASVSEVSSTPAPGTTFLAQSPPPPGVVTVPQQFPAQLSSTPATNLQHPPQ